MSNNHGVGTDYFLYNGPIERGKDLDFIEIVDQEKVHDACVLFLVTGGGNPDAAFKMARYLQQRYEKFTVAITGACKSAGSLMAIGAHEVAFAPYGELGPLDVQLSKTDHLAQLESGLNISDAFLTLEERAIATYSKLVFQIISSSAGVIAFPTASHAAKEIISALYGPIFARIDPEEVGSRSRAMRIGTDYGERLNVRSENLKDGALNRLASSYSSHTFVIDYAEAQMLFKRTRTLDDVEIRLVQGLKGAARYPQHDLLIQKLDPGERKREVKGNGTAHVGDRPLRSGEEADGGNPAKAG